MSTVKICILCLQLFCSECEQPAQDAQEPIIKDKVSATNADIDINMGMSFSETQHSSHNNHNSMNSCPICSNSSCQCREIAIKEEVSATNIDNNINLCTSHNTTELSSHNNQEWLIITHFSMVCKPNHWLSCAL